MDSREPPIADLLAGVVNGDASAMDEITTRPLEDVIHEALDHGLLAFLNDGLSAGAQRHGAMAVAVRRQAQQSLLEDLLREAQLKGALAALDDASVRPLIIKGGQLAYSYYPRPDLRPRVDDDLLIPQAGRSALHDVLTRLDYRRQGGIAGDLVSYQSMYVKQMNGAITSALDVHWRIANAQVFAGVLDYDELASTAVPIPALGHTARGLSTMHALLLACVHRVAHHLDSDRLIWLYDIHLLAAAMAPADWQAFASLAADRQVVAVCRRSLERTQARFPTPIPDQVWTHPAWSGAPRPELSAGYLRPRRNISAMADDLRALSSWSDRWRLAREHLFPPAPYMRTVFAPTSRAPLVWLHTRRLLRGARKWLSRAEP